jgi:hypothetical protein
VEAPFWTAVAGRDPRIDSVRIHLNGIRDSSIAAARRTFELDHFSIQSESPRLWRYGGSATIQCGAPIPDPDVFLIEFSDWLYARGASSDLRDYCGEESFVSLARRLSQTTFVLLAGPTAIVDEAARRLGRLGVAFRIDSSPRPSPALLDVTFGESWVVCESAVIEQANQR